MAFCNLTIEDASEPVVSVESVSVTPESITMEIGGTSELIASVSPSNATNKALIWKSDAAEVAAVDAEGTVNAIASGTARITVTTVDGNFTANCVVTVKEKEPEVSVNLALDATAAANSESSSTFKASKANDGAMNTRWLAKSNTSDIYLELDFKKDVTFSRVNISEFDDRISSYAIQAWDGAKWVDVYTGDTIGKEFSATFDSVTASKVRLMIYATNTNYGASIWEFEVYE